jgi:hypothetical protein
LKKTEKFWDIIADKRVGSVEKITLLFNKFGDANVDYYRIYSGTNPNPTALLDTSKLTLIQFDDFEHGKEYYFRVKAVDKSGNESDYSNEVCQLFDPVEPGENMVKNGDFSNDSNNWFFILLTAQTRTSITVCAILLLRMGDYMKRLSSFLSLI